MPKKTIEKKTTQPRHDHTLYNWVSVGIIVITLYYIAQIFRWNWVIWIIATAFGVGFFIKKNITKRLLSIGVMICILILIIDILNFGFLQVQVLQVLTGILIFYVIYALYIMVK